MNLPDYFLADLPPEAVLTPSMIAEACQSLRRNREHYLAPRTTAQLIEVLSATAQEWLQEEYPFRRIALDRGPAATGFPREILAQGLGSLFSQVTRENLYSLLEQDLGHAQRLDSFAASDPDRLGRQSALARGPELLVHITAGNIPSLALVSLIFGLLVRSAQFVKCARGSSLLPRLFAHSLHEVEPKLASCIELAEWPGGTASLEEPLFAEADCVTATGSDDTLAAIRSRLPQRTRFLGYGQQVSFGFVSRDALAGAGAAKVIAAAADDVVAWNQMGCLSPHVFYVQSGGAMAPEQFAARLAGELTRREATHPRGELAVHESVVISLKRDFYRVRAAAECATQLWHSPDSTAWTVVFEGDARFQLSCLNRFVYVKAVGDLGEALRNAESVRGRTSTVGVAAPGPDARELAMQLARWGVTRVCALGQMQRPPLTWRHDGRPALGELVTWTNWEH